MQPLLLFSVRSTIGPALDILFLWLVFYAILRFLRGSRGLGVLRGLLIILTAVFLGAWAVQEVLNIPLSAFGLITIDAYPYLFLAMVIVFQPEIRRGFSRLGENPLIRALARTSERTPSRAIATAVERMSRRRVGALIVIERMTGVRSIIEQGVALASRVDAALLESIFHPGTPLHDGAVIIRGDQIVAASCIVPLTDNPGVGHLGTRHRAAIGVTEESDAIALVVSEETGRMSLAEKGVLVPVADSKTLERRLKALLEDRETLEEVGA
ncbi:MAG: diadenylate cyclase CdaA [Planctomycetota bacterium]